MKQRFNCLLIHFVSESSDAAQLPDSSISGSVALGYICVGGSSVCEYMVKITRHWESFMGTFFKVTNWSTVQLDFPDQPPYVNETTKFKPERGTLETQH